MENTQELSKKIVEQNSRIQQAAIAVVKYAQTLIPVLRDSGREHSAKELERLLFEHDVLMEEALNLLRDNAGLVVEMLRNQSR